MGKYKNVQERIQNALGEGGEKVQKAAKEVGNLAAKTMDDVKDKVGEITEDTGKKVTAAKKAAKTTTVKKAAQKSGKASAKSDKAVLSKNAKTKLVFQYSGEQADADEIIKKIEKDAISKCGKITIKKLDIYLNADENAVYYVVNGEAKPEYKVML